MQRHADLLASIDAPQRSRRGSFEPVLELVDPLPRGRALDAPCGPGLLTEALRRMGFDVVGADLDAEGFAFHDRIPFRRCDLDEPLPFEANSFGLVHCGDGIEHLENPFRLMRELARVLTPDGTLVVATPNYLNLERRLRFLLSGSLTRPAPRTGSTPGPGEDRGHINPLTLTRLARMAEDAGLTLVLARTALAKPRQRWLAPLALAPLAYRALVGPERRRDLFAEHTQSLRMLLGGKKLLAVFRREDARRTGV